jgi:hypothetical protein
MVVVVVVVWGILPIPWSLLRLQPRLVTHPRNAILVRRVDNLAPRGRHQNVLPQWRGQGEIQPNGRHSCGDCIFCRRCRCGLSWWPWWWRHYSVQSGASIFAPWIGSMAPTLYPTTIARLRKRVHSGAKRQRNKSAFDFCNQSHHHRHHIDKQPPTSSSSSYAMPWWLYHGGCGAGCSFPSQ